MIDYSIRTSARSRYVRLSVTSHHGVVIVIPRYYDQAKIPAIIAKKEQWLKQALQKVQYGSNVPTVPFEIPASVYLSSIGMEYTIAVEYHHRRKCTLRVSDSTITLSLNSNNQKSGITLLKKWSTQKAKEILLPWLRSVSDDHNLPYNSAVIRSQRTRWGSCSLKKNINLNRLLIFLPPHLVEYLFIHELCHTVEMNHSKRYWLLVEKHCANYKLLDKELKKSSGTLMRWVHL